MYINDIHSLVPSITLSLSKSSIRSWSCHRHHLVIYITGIDIYSFFNFYVVVLFLLDTQIILITPAQSHTHTHARNVLKCNALGIIRENPILKSVIKTPLLFEFKLYYNIQFILFFHLI
jgi:hypothetical protein